jgi:hypothetical protein
MTHRLSSLNFHDGKIQYTCPCRKTVLLDSGRDAEQRLKNPDSASCETTSQAPAGGSFLCTVSVFIDAKQRALQIA